MTKELEALNRLISIDKECNYISQAVKDDFNLVENALKRIEPMKVIRSSNSNVISAYCPKCKRVVNIGYNGCPYCLQRLDWRDEK